MSAGEDGSFHVTEDDPYAEIRLALPKPVGVQSDVVALEPRGHNVILGTAGSGKTTMAMLRALMLADPRTEHAGRTLLVTFNKSLLAFLKHVIPDGTVDLDVRNYHRFARGYLNARGAMRPNSIVDPYSRAELISRALEIVRAERREQVLSRDDDFFGLEIEWMARNGALDERTYLDIERVGRGEALGPRARSAAFAVREEYIRLREVDGYEYDWDDLASAACVELGSDISPRLYRHVVIDEGQDFSPEMLKSLALAIPDEGSLTFFGDAAQQIYGRGLSWRSAGLNVRQVIRFTKNYRNSPEIASLGLAIAAMPYFRDVPDMVAPDGFADAGPPPTLVRFDDADEELAFVREQAIALGAIGPVGVLFRRDGDAERFAASCPSANRLTATTATWSPTPMIWAGTVHSAKGFEFQSVIIPGLSEHRWPEPEAVNAEGEEAAVANDGRLLYVAITRARQNLIMTTPVPLTRLLPSRDGLWLEQSQ
jgi:superfamily I DNA/RNA helicase